MNSHTDVDRSRRRFLIGGATLAAAAATARPGLLLAALQKPGPSRLDLTEWSDVRAQFPLTREYRHFASFFIASHPKPVREAIENFRRTLDANPFLTVERGMFESETENLQVAVREDVARYLGGKPDEIALTSNTTMGLALVYHGLPLKAGDEVLTTTHDHYSQHESIRFATARAGAKWRKISLFERSATATPGEMARRLGTAIRPATRVVGLTWVHSSTGVRLPIRRLAEVVRMANQNRAEKDRILLVLDGVHGLGAVDETIAEMGCDFFCAGTHKWMFAPRGTGIVWARAANWAKVRPTIPSFSELASYQAWMDDKPVTTPSNAMRVTPGGFFPYEHQWAMGAAFRFHETIGRDRVGYRIRQLNDQLKEGLARVGRVTIHTPRDPDLSAGIVAFEIDGFEPDKVVKLLLERKIVASTSPYKPSYVRLAPSLVNDPAEVETALSAVRAIAAT